MRTGVARLADPQGTGRHGRVLLICLTVALLILLLDHAWPPLTELELRTLDWRFERRGARPRASEVVLVTIDEKSLAEPRLHHWPWPRSVYATLLADWVGTDPRDALGASYPTLGFMQG